MKQRSEDWVGIANAALSARNRLRTDGLSAIDAILREGLDPSVRQQVEAVRRAVAAAANELRAALKGRGARA